MFEASSTLFDPSQLTARGVRRGTGRRHGRRRRRALGGLAIVALVTMLGACSADDSASSSGKGDSPLIDFAKDRSKWVLPMDQFSLDMPQALYALDLATYECVAEQGMGDQLAVPQPFHPEDNVFEGAAARRLFNVEIASEYGYHVGPADMSAPDPNFVSVTTIHDTPEGEAVYQDCREQATANVPEGIDEGMLQNGFTSAIAFQIGLDASDAVGTDPDVLDAVERWHECMAPLGIADIPDDPRDMPSASMRDAYGLNADETGGATVDEIRVAVADAECRESSGYAETAYNVEWDAQVESMAEHEDDLIRAQAAREALQEYIESTISDFGAGNS